MASRLPSTPPVLSGFTYVRPLGAGGFADVFLFEQNLPRRSVAVKVLLQSVVDAEVLRMFNAEADVMARLSSHPSILTVYSASISADGRPYLVMEYCPNGPAGRFRRNPFSTPDALEVGVRIASALETAHRAGVLHRDIKPSNILHTAYNAAVLSDFGIASSLSHSSAAELFAMSVPWSAPEVVEERTTGTVASEVWGFGATLYSLLAGRTPFEPADGAKVTTEQLRQRIRRGKYAPITRPDVPASLNAALAQMMSLDPRKRPKTMKDCAELLRAVQAEIGLTPTALEVAVDEWAAAGAPIDFDNRLMRQPVVAPVLGESSRARERARARSRSARPPEAAPQPSDDGTTVARAKPSYLWLKLAAAVGVGVGLAVAGMAALRLF
ncbi:serine/threonine-protein kinase [Microterricola viridarii]|uniref:non-specific serine/threonine protein kinase n=1 Tax=Microterricola viridarii TaxID=412690 RepID=A0A109QWC0_9MICO|nr:serine/threonine-protein kinase [Microterricola viridarii]AMB57645.1 serine/threonine protein kinase [Microterricola viridarii]